MITGHGNIHIGVGEPVGTWCWDSPQGCGSQVRVFKICGLGLLILLIIAIVASRFQR